MTQNRWTQAVGWPLLLLLIVVCFSWKLLLTDQYTWLEGPDTANQVVPWFQFEARELHQGHIPLWDSNLWGGQPLLAQTQPGLAYPLNWLLFLAPLKDGSLRQSYLHWYFVLIHFQAALFCYWLCRDLKRSPGASLLAGVVFAMGGFVGTNVWPQMLNGAVWAPLILLYFLRAMRGERPVASAAWSGACLGMAFLSGHHQIPIFISLAMAGVWLYYLASDTRKWNLLLVFGLFLFLVSALQVLPAYEYGRNSLRWVNAVNPVGWSDNVPYYVHQEYSFYPESIFGVVIPGIFRHTDPFVGLVALTLAFIGLSAGWADRTARLFGGIAIGGLVFSLGFNSVFHGVLYALVPMVEKARSASMAIFIFNFGICVLTAYGIDSYLTINDALARRIAWIVAGFATLIGLIVWALLVAKSPFDGRIGMVVLAGFLLAGILIAWRRSQISRPAAIASLALLMLLELGSVTTPYNYPAAKGTRETVMKSFSEHDDIVAFLKNQKGPVRTEVQSNDIPYNFGDWHGVDHFGGYLASLTTNVSRVQGMTPGRMLFAANYYLGREPIRPDQVEVFTGHSGVKVYRNPGALPRGWVVHEALAIQRDNQVGSTLESPSFDPRRQTFLRGSIPDLEKRQEGETVTLVDREFDRVTLEADLKSRGMVIDADTFYPGWIAEIDGAPAVIYEAYGVLRGVVVEAGRHRIEMRYRPRSVYWGAALTAIGLLGAVLLRFR